VSNIEAVRKGIELAATAYSREFGDISIPLIPEVVEWTARVDRALAAPAGHVLLTGRAGVGRLAALKVACYQLKIELVRLHMGRDYSMKNFKADLKAVIAKATVENERVALAVEDHNFVNEDVLEMVNSLIASGEVPGLYTPEELDQLLPPLREPAADEGFTGGVYQFFQQRLRANLKVCLIMDPRHSLFAVRCTSNPALLTRCTVLWIDTWTEEGMKALCKQVYRDVIKESLKDDDKLNVPAELIVIHKSVGDRGTPELFKSVMQTFRTVYQTKAKTSRDQAQRLSAGLQKLNEAQEQVDKTKAEVSEKMKEVEKKQTEADEALTEIQQNMSDSAEQRTRAEELTKQLDEERQVIAVKSDKIAAELSTITPMLEAAREAVSGIKSENLNEIRSLKTPPEAIRDVLEGVLGLLGVQDTTWTGMRKFLGERGAKESIIAFDAKSVTPQARDHVMKLLQQRGNSFKHENIVRASVAAAPLASWVKANVEYSMVLERIDPLQQQLKDLEDNKAKAEDKLGRLKDKLKKIDKNVEALRKDFAKRCKEAERLKEALEKATKQLETAEKLLNGLAGERLRWGEQSAAIEAVVRTIPRKAVVAAGFMTYLGAESEDSRASFVKKWCSRLKIDTLAVGPFLRSESQLLKLKSEGLPGDNLSMENAVVMLDANRTPLVIDPATQAMDWLVAHLKAKDTTVEVASISDERFTHTLELAIRFGKTFIATEIDRIDTLLFPVLRRDLVSLGPKKVVQLGSKQVDWQENFRIFLFTRTTDLVLPPDAAALVTLVNFSVTRSGLQSQLLGNTIKHERPEMEQLKVELLHKEEALKVQLAGLEESLLNDLANSHGNLLDNPSLIDSLQTIKTQSKDIGDALEQSKRLQEELAEKREVFRPHADVGANLYFLVQEMAALNRMYQFSLAVFLDLFHKNLATYNGASDDVSAKMNALSATLCQRTFLYVSRGLFKTDRVPFGLHVVRGLQPDDFPTALWDVFNGRSKLPADGVSVPSWAVGNQVVLSDELQAVHAADPEALGRWSLHDAGRWSAWLKDGAEADKRILELLPSHMDALMFTSIFFKEKLVAVMTRIVLKRLQLPALAEVTTIESLLPETTATVPILLITSTGADPSLEVQEVAWKTVGRDGFTQIALGGGQTDEALAQVRRCAIAGEWIFLKNLHLVLGWVPTLEKEVCAMTNPNPNFRLFLTTEPHDLFPSVLLKSSLKMTVESPPGVKQNMLGVYSGWTPQSLSERTPQQAQLLFALTWFHAVIAERRSYIPQGWVKFYEFTPADLRSAADIVVSQTTTQQKGAGGAVDWTTLRGIFDDAVYGGRLDNDQDMRVLKVFLRRVFNDEVAVQAVKPLFAGLTVPKSNDHAAHVKAIQQLPDVNHTAMFHLPVNADNVVLEAQGARFRNDLKTLASGAAAASTGGAGALAASTLGQLLGDVYKLWEASQVAAPPPVPEVSASASGSFPDPIDVFLSSELGLLAGLIRTVRRLFAHMKDVIDGTALPSGELKAAAPALAAFSTPDPWLDRMPASESLGAWLSALAKKQASTVEWHRSYKAGTLLTSKLALTDLLRPHTFLNALRQYTARKASVPLAALRLRAVAGGSSVPGAKITVALAAGSMAIQGAKVDGSGRLAVPDSDTPSTVPFIDTVVGWTTSEDQGSTTIPMYTSSTRELHLLDITTATSGSEADDWTLRGAAVVLAGN
jgi:dynein heavy chain 2